MINKLFIVLLSFHLTLTANASGAIAYSSSENQYFIAINRANEKEAIDAVMKCRDKGYSDCKLMTSTDGGGYGAIAHSAKNGSSSSVLGYKSKKEAEYTVLSRCNKKFGKCYITDSWQDVGRIVEVPVQQKILTGFVCMNPNTKLGDPYCEGVDVNGNRY